MLPRPLARCCGGVGARRPPGEADFRPPGGGAALILAIAKALPFRLRARLAFLGLSASTATPSLDGPLSLLPALGDLEGRRWERLGERVIDPARWGGVTKPGRLTPVASTPSP